MSGEQLAPNSTDDFAPRKAPVVPRARRAGTDAALPLDRLLLPLIQGKAHGLVVITAGPGGGKTTALRHLRAVLPDEMPIAFRDTLQPGEADRSAESQLLISAADKRPGGEALDAFELCPWTLDDCLEYLVAVHRQQCGSVLKRLREDPSLPALKGRPELLTLVMDAMAADSLIPSARDVLRNQVGQIIPPGPDRDRFVLDSEARLNAEQCRWLRHDFVRQICTAQWVADELSRETIPDLLKSMKRSELIPEIAAAVRSRPQALEFMQRLVRSHSHLAAVPMSASILLRVDPSWRPDSGRAIHLVNAQLANARWSGIDLSDAFLSGANLSRADLSGANLVVATADRANLSGANLRGARMDRILLEKANLQSADLFEACAPQAVLSHADLDGANLAHATFNEAKFIDANMENADCRWANFSRAILAGTRFGGADLQSTNFGGARINHVDMSEAKWTGASFPNARLGQCNLEGLELPYANFEHADLTGSLLTGSLIPGGNFRGASFCQAGLADIDWENADLRDADFTQASFHLGSTRSGLVGSTIPGEGSRTGFYTDEFNEQVFKSPEEIRKACLCGANLLRAKVEGTDFYLVDLRRAVYSKSQAEHFVRSGAILVSRSE